MTGQRIIDPHVHLWDPRTTPRQITPLVKLLGRFPNVLERVGRAVTPTPLVEFVGESSGGIVNMEFAGPAESEVVVMDTKKVTAMGAQSWPMRPHCHS